VAYYYLGHPVELNLFLHKVGHVGIRTNWMARNGESS